METESRQPKPTTAPSPLVPQGTLPDGRGKSHIRIAVFSILAVHAVLLGTLLIFGCKKAPDPAADQTTVSEPTNNAFPAPPPQMTFAPTEFPQPSHAPPPPLSTSTTAEPPPSIPAVPPLQPSTHPGSDSAREHIVLKGESFYTVAKKYNTTVRAVSQSNPGVDPTRLKIGQKLVIPSASQTTATLAAAAEPASPAGTGSDRVHVVKAGENLTIIARRHGIGVKDLQAANNLRTTQIRVGQKLRLPEKTASPAAADVIPPLTPASSTAAQPTSAAAVPQ